MASIPPMNMRHSVDDEQLATLISTMNGVGAETAKALKVLSDVMADVMVSLDQLTRTIAVMEQR